LVRAIIVIPYNCAAVYSQSLPAIWFADFGWAGSATICDTPSAYHNQRHQQTDSRRSKGQVTHQTCLLWKVGFIVVLMHVLAQAKRPYARYAMMDLEEDETAPDSAYSGVFPPL